MKTASPDAPVRRPWPTNSADLHDAIRHRAEEIYVRNGRLAGHDTENWVQAEAEIRAECAAHSALRTAVVVRFEGIQYVGEYAEDFADGYTPGEFAAGDPVLIRFEGEKMFVKRPNGKQLETTIVQRVG